MDYSGYFKTQEERDASYARYLENQRLDKLQPVRDRARIAQAKYDKALAKHVLEQGRCESARAEQGYISGEQSGRAFKASNALDRRFRELTDAKIAYAFAMDEYHASKFGA